MPKPVSSELARLQTQQSWHRFQARERQRRRAARLAAILCALALLALLFLFLQSR